MKNLTTFQLVTLGLFGALIIIGTLVFSLGRSGSGDQVATVSVWGFITQTEFNSVLEASSLKDNKLISVSYQQKNPETFDTDFVNALADGFAPDVFFVDQSMILKQANRITEIPFDSYPQRNFQNNFAEGAEVFLTPTGVRAVPIAIDPVVLYWNRNLFTNEGFTTAPNSWASYTSLVVDVFTKRDGALTISQSALPFGTWDNLQDAKGVLSALIFQGGGDITDQTTAGTVISTLNAGGARGINPAEAALNFFVDFSNPQKDVYSWNRSLPNSRDYFASGLAATYVGFASDIKTIQSKNPNLNFDIALMPQGANSTKVTYADITALALSKSARNITAGANVIYALTEPKAMLQYNSITQTAPSARTLLARPDSADAFSPVIYSSAVISKTWLEPDAKRTEQIFADMVNSVVSGRKRVSDSVKTAHEELSNLLK